MEGRVTVFSISGCPHCRAAKNLLKKKDVEYVEINLDVYPERRPEMEALAKKSSVPQIFFNDELIGGNDNLQALEKSGTLDFKIETVRKTPVPPTAPLPPQITTGTNAEVGSLTARKQDELAAIAGRLSKGVKAGSHLRLPNLFKLSFTGKEAIDFLSQDSNISRSEAAVLGSRLISRHFLRSLSEKSELADCPVSLYRFLHHEQQLQPAGHRCLNFLGDVSGVEPPGAVDLGEQLRKIILAIYEQFLSEDGLAVDYIGIASSEAFKRYVTKAEELQRVDVSGLTREEKLALFINLYNAIVIHATVANNGEGPSSALQRKTFFSSFTYLIGGEFYSLTQIENGILRANKRAPYALGPPFSSNDRRLKVALSECEPLIHFALVCGAKSCPPIKTYKPINIDDSLRSAAKSFFESGSLEIDTEKRVISLSKILFWYHDDFGATDDAMLAWIQQYVAAENKLKLENLLNGGKYKIAYQPYDWSGNGKH